MQLSQLNPPVETILQVPQGIRVEHRDIKQLLHWYKDEFHLVVGAIYNKSELETQIKFSDYPFTKGKMPFVSSNLINLAMDQSVLIHMGLMIKDNFLQVITPVEHGGVKVMTFEEYDKKAGDEFVTARLEGKYSKPISPSQNIKVINVFEDMKKMSSGRYILKFLTECEYFFTIRTSVIFPLNL